MGFESELGELGLGTEFDGGMGLELAVEGMGADGESAGCAGGSGLALALPLPLPEFPAGPLTVVLLAARFLWSRIIVCQQRERDCRL